MANSRFGKVAAVEEERVVALSTTYTPKTILTVPSILDLLLIEYEATPSGNTLIKLTTGNGYVGLLETVTPALLSSLDGFIFTDAVFIPANGKITVELSDQNANLYFRTSKAE